MVGTFRDRLGDSSAVYKGEWDDKKASLLGDAERDAIQNERRPQKPWSSQGYLGLQKPDHMTYYDSVLFGC